MGGPAAIRCIDPGDHLTVRGAGARGLEGDAAARPVPAVEPRRSGDRQRAHAARAATPWRPERAATPRSSPPWRLALLARRRHPPMARGLHLGPLPLLRRPAETVGVAPDQPPRARADTFVTRLQRGRRCRGQCPPGHRFLQAADHGQDQGVNSVRPMLRMSCSSGGSQSVVALRLARAAGRRFLGAGRPYGGRAGRRLWSARTTRRPE